MIDVVMPQMGESIVEGTLTKWLKKSGDKVERDEPLFEISTDKVDTEIPSPAAGTLGEILVEEGATVGINTIVGRINDGASAAPAATAPAPVQAAPPAQPPAPPAPPQAPPPPQPAAQPPKQETTPIAEISHEEQGGPLSPLVRKLAREYNIELKQVRGTGAGGRVTKQDVENYISAQAQKTVQGPAPVQAQPQEPPPPPALSQPQPPPPQQETAVTYKPQQQQDYAPIARAEKPGTRVEPMSIMRQKIAEHMIFSKRTSAHVTTVHKTDFTKIAKLRDKHKAAFLERYGFALTFLPFVLRATAVALRQYPILNASIEGTNILYHNDINLGIAVALENGLIVPVIRQSDEKNIVGLQRSIADLANRARSRQLKPDEVTGGTFSITNFGSFGSVFATPVINQPQVAILGVGTVEKQPVVIDDAIAIRSIAYLALTFDHRLIDGALADQFTGKVKQLIETWSEEIM